MQSLAFGFDVVKRTYRKKIIIGKILNFVAQQSSEF